MLTTPDFHTLHAAIYQRKSIRDYSPDEISEDLITQIQDFIKKIPALKKDKVDFHVAMSEFKIIHNLVNPFGAFISVAPYFFVVSAKKEGPYMIEAGFQSEHLILFLTSLGLATCYIGGFLDFKNLSRELGLKDSKEVLILSPVGHPDKSLAGFFTGFMVNTSKMLYGTTKRKSLDEILINPPESGDKEGLLAFWQPVLEAVQAAPSWCNLQPWRFFIQDKEMYLFVEHTSKDVVLKYESWGNDYRLFDAGIAMCHFQIAAAQAGIKGKWELLDTVAVDVPSRYKPVAHWKGV